MSEKKLGRGLEYLLNISGNDQLVTSRVLQKPVQQIDVNLISKNRFQPRKTFDQQGITDLKESIKENGLLQPILIKKKADGYELIAGERRLRACKSLNMPTIPAIEIDVADDKLLQLAIIENLQREDLNAIEEAKAFQSMINLESLSHEDLSKKIGKNRSTITNTLRLLDLPELVQEHVSRGTISQGHARAMLGLKDHSEMIKVLKDIIKNGLSVRSVEKYVKQILSQQSEQPKPDTGSQDNNIKSYEEILTKNLATKVSINNNKNKGYIKIHYYSNNDFQAIFERLSKNI